MSDIHVARDPHPPSEEVQAVMDQLGVTVATETDTIKYHEREKFAGSGPLGLGLISILESYDGDWRALYKRGRKIFEGHSISLERGLHELGIPFEIVAVPTREDGCYDGSEFPDALENANDPTFQ